MPDVIPEITPPRAVLQKLVLNPPDYAGLGSPGCANKASSSHQGNSSSSAPARSAFTWRGEDPGSSTVLQSTHFSFVPCAFYLAVSACGRASLWLFRRSRTRYEGSCAYCGENQCASGTPAGGLVLDTQGPQKFRPAQRLFPNSRA